MAYFQAHPFPAKRIKELEDVLMPHSGLDIDEFSGGDEA